MNLFQRLRERRRNRQFQLFREWQQLNEQARSFTTMTCPRCLAPASSPAANYCIECGLSLRLQLEQWMPEQEAHTDPVMLIERPLTIRQRAFDRAVNTDTLHIAIPPKGGYRE